MKNLNTLGPMGLIALASCISLPLQADDANWYMGANLGETDANIDINRISENLSAGGFTTTGVSTDEKNLGGKLFAGYQFNRFLSFEAGYFDLGSVNFRTDTAPEGSLNGSMKTRGLNFDMVGYIPLHEAFSLFGRVGVNYALSKDNFYGTGAVTINDTNPSKREANLKLGYGVQYAINDNWALRLEEERYHINDAVSNRGDIDLISLGVVYRIGAAAQPEYIPAPKPAAPPAPIEPEPAPPQKFEKRSVSANELFGFNSAIVRAPHGELDAIAKALSSDNAPKQIRISGYTDRLGSDQYNQKLSLERAQGVKTYLVMQGISPNRLIVEGHGEADPVVTCNDKQLPDLIQCLAPNRRVEIDEFSVIKAVPNQ